MPHRDATILGIGVVDGRGARGTFLPPCAWPADDADPLSTRGVFRRLYGRTDPTYRRIDRLSRALVIAAEAAGVGRLPAAARVDTGLVLESWRGCLESDVAFATSLAMGTVLGPLFPYTLTSTCLGELALRHGLRGPTLSLSTTSERTGAALWTARAMLEQGEASHAVAACAEVLERARGDVLPSLRAIVVCLGPGASGVATTRWPSREADAFTELAASL